MSKPWSNLARVVYARTYSRPMANGLKESYPDTVERVIGGNVRNLNVSEQEISRLRYYMLERKGGPAGRGYWYSGSPGHAKLGGTATVNCFAGETEFITFEGIKKLRDCAGTVQTVLTSGGKWVEAPIRSFGVQPLMKVSLSLGRAKKEIFATEGHVWRIVRRDGENIPCTTASLQVGDACASNHGQGIKGVLPSPFGIAQGFVFGDGSDGRISSTSRCSGRATLCGEKAPALLPYFSLCSQVKREGIGTEVRDLPTTWKEFPNIRESKSFLYGWLAGYFAADGSVKEDGQVRIASTSLENLEFVRSVCAVLGIRALPIIFQDRISNLTNRESRLYSLTLDRHFLTPEFFVLPAHRDLFVQSLSRKRKSEMRWKVESVEKTDRVEEVFCAQVEDTHTFTLSDSILTSNCWFLLADDWMNYVLAQDLLMLGGGVGMSVEHRFVSKLPRVRKGVVIIHKATKDADFIVPDSREGWNELTRRVLEAFFVTGKSFSYSTVCVRGSGEPILGFGGVASGPRPLIAFVEKLYALLVSREGKFLKPIDAADILTAIAEMVVSGNVRRSAIIIIGDCFDKEYLKAKRWDLGEIPTHRANANYSVVCDDVDDLHPLFWKTYETGEPFGIVNRTTIRKFGRMGELKKDTAQGVNPCQPAWATVLTPEGIRTFAEIDVGSVIWSGKDWTKVTKKWSTGVKQVCQWTTSAGTFSGTENHRILSGGEKIPVSEAGSIDSATGPLPSRKEWNCQDVMDGLVFGDGSVHKASNNKVVLYVGKDDQDYFTGELSALFQSRCGVNCPERSDQTWTITTTIGHEELPKTYERKIPLRFFKGGAQKSASFLRGLYSANGSVCGNRVTLKSASWDVVSGVQELLSSLGIRSYITTNRQKTVDFRNGPFVCRESYDLNIGTLDGRKAFQSFIGFLQAYKNSKLDDIIKDREEATRRIKSTFDIQEVSVLGFEEVFDITVDAPEHTYWTGGLLVSNCAEATLEDGEPCCLTEIALPNLESPEEFEEVATLLHRYGKRVTMDSYHNPKCDEVIKRNRRIGSGITGCLESPLFTPEILDRVYAAIQRENVAYSSELGIPPSIRTTVVKPSGTLSKMFDVRCEGIHAAYSRFSIQRVRFSASDPLVPLLRAAGHHIEPVIRFDGSHDSSTVVVDFYLEAPAGVPCADEGWTTWKQLDAMMMAQKHWADQAVSVTVYYRREEIPQIKEWLANNLDKIKTISFLCHNDHGFKQAPKEAIDVDQYYSLSEKISPIEIEQSGGDSEVLSGLECEGGACPVR